MEQEKIAQLEEELRTTHLEIKLEQLNVKGKTGVFSFQKDIKAFLTTKPKE